MFRVFCVNHKQICLKRDKCKLFFKYPITNETTKTIFNIKINHINSNF